MDSLGSVGRHISQISIYTLAWGGFFVVLRNAVFPKRSATFSNVVISWIHAIVAASLAVHLGAVDWAHPLQNYGAPPTDAQITVLTVSLAYFLYDMICCELIKHELPNLLHHISTLAGLVVGVFYNVVRSLGDPSRTVPSAGEGVLLLNGLYSCTPCKRAARPLWVWQSS